MKKIFKIIPPAKAEQLLGLLVLIYNEVKPVLNPLLKLFIVVTFTQDVTVNGCVTWRSYVIPQMIVGAIIAYIFIGIYASAGEYADEEEEEYE